MLFLYAYLALYNKLNNSLCKFRLFCSDFFASFSSMFCLFSVRTESLCEREQKRKRRQQNTNKRREGGREWGPVAGAQVSAATQRTCTSDSGTDVCTTLSLRHDNAMTDASGKGGCERDNSTATMKLELYGFRV